MASVSWAIPCRYCEANGGLATIVGAGIDTFWVTELPTNIGMLVAVRIVFGDDELDDEHELEFVLRDPAMDEAGRLSGTFSNMEANPNKEPGWQSAIVVPTAHEFRVAEPGTFTLELVLDGRSQQTIPFLVKEGPPPGA